MPIELVTDKKRIEESCVKLLSEALEEARSGEISECVIIMLRRDGFWAWRHSETLRTSETIGRLEIVKHEIMAKYRESQ